MNKEKKSDITLRVISLLVALTLWAYVMSIENPERTNEYKNIKVAFANTHILDKQGLIVMSPEEVKVSVKVSGRNSDMGQFSTDMIKATIDLSGYSEGQVRVPINVILNQANSNLKIVNYEPKEVLFNFDKIITKNIPVTIETTGNLEAGYVLGDVTTNTQSILVRGPKTWVNEISKALAVVDITGMKQNTPKNIPIRIVDDENKDVEGITNEPKTVDVVTEVFRTMTVPISLKLENDPPENFELTNILISPTMVTIKGDNSISNIEYIETKPINLDYSMESISMPIELNLPENVTLLNPDEKFNISLNIEENFVKNFEYEIREIEKRNLGENLKLDEETDAKIINISIKGKQSIVENIEKEDLEVYLQLTNLKEGTHTTSIYINLPEGSSVKELSQETIEINIIND